MNICITDWSDSDNWDPMRARRDSDLMSIWPGWTSRPRAGARCIVTWSWPSLFGNVAGTVFNTNPASIFGAWGAMVVANGWHLFNGTPRIIFPNGDFSSYAVDLRINACADALADFVIDWAGLSWMDGNDGIHVDYCLNPAALGAASFSEFFTDVQFQNDFDAGIARFLNRLRTRMPNWLLIGQMDQRQIQSIEDPLNGYFLEEYIGRFVPQTSFNTVQNWILAHAQYLQANHPGREQVWIIEYRNPQLTTNPPFGMTRDQFLEAHKTLCTNTGSYLSYARERAAQYRGHLPAPGKTKAIKIIRPAGIGDTSSWQPPNSFVDVNDQDDNTLVRTDVPFAKDMFVYDPITDPEAEAILDVSLVFRAVIATTSIRSVWKGNGVNGSGNKHDMTAAFATYRDDNVLCPSGEWDLAEFQAGMFQGGYESLYADDVHNALLGEAWAEVAIEVDSPDDDEVVSTKVVLDLSRSHKAFVPPDKESEKAKMALSASTKTEIPI